MKNSKAFTLIVALLLALSWPGAPVIAGPGAVSATLCSVAAIQEIHPDGTLLLSDGKKIRMPEQALGHEAVKLREEVVLLTKAGMTELDSAGRVQGWVLILDPSERECLPEEDEKTPEADAAENFLRGIETGMAGRSTVAVPVGMGLKLFAEQAAVMSAMQQEGETLLRNLQLAEAPSVPESEFRGGTIFLENGREIRMEKNVFSFPAVVQKRHRLLFCARA